MYNSCEFLLCKQVYWYSPHFFFLYTLQTKQLTMREDLISSAISFLSDPKVQSAPLAKKVSFLESKGMTSEEIEEAMARVNGKSAAVATTTTTVGNPQPGTVMYPAAVPPPVPTRPSYDWRDIFIAAVLAGGVGYGVWTLAKVKYRETDM